MPETKSSNQINTDTAVNLGCEAKLWAGYPPDKQEKATQTVLD